MFSNISRNMMSVLRTWGMVGAKRANSSAITALSLNRFQRLGKYLAQGSAGKVSSPSALTLPCGRIVTVGKEVGRGVSRKVYEGTIEGATEARPSYAVMHFKTIPFFLKRCLWSQSKIQQYRMDKVNLVQDEMNLKKEIGAHPNLDTAITSTHKIGGSTMVLKPWIEHSMNGYLKNENPTFVQILHVLRGVADGVAYLHSKNIYHCDLKPDNFLVHQGEGIVSDFGHSVSMGTSSSQRGDPEYLEPHVFEMDEQCDVYALLLSYLDILAPQEWLHATVNDQRQCIEDFKGYLKSQVVGKDRSERPSAKELGERTGEFLERAKALGDFPQLISKKRIVFRDYQTRDLLLPPDSLQSEFD